MDGRLRQFAAAARSPSGRPSGACSNARSTAPARAIAWTPGGARAVLGRSTCSALRNACLYSGTRTGLREMSWAGRRGLRGGAPRDGLERAHARALPGPDRPGARTRTTSCAAVRLAASRGDAGRRPLGGHSWAGNHVRDGGLLLDVSRLDEVDGRRRGDDGDGRARAAAATSCSRRSPSRTSSSPPATARASASAATCCRAASAGTAASTARPA